MDNKTFHFDFKTLNLTISRIEEVIGFNEGGDRNFVCDLIGEILNETQAFADIKAQYSVFHDIKFISDTRSVEINNTSFEVKNIVYTQIKKSGSIAIFLCTAGHEIGIRSRKAMQERDLLRGYVYDVVGSEIVEAAADLMQNELGKEALLSGMKITNRYSPGYCGWDVAEQHRLFHLVPDNYCGIKLTPSALMNPVKSVSGFIGIGRYVKSNPYTCNICDMKNCIYRRVRERKV